MPKSVLIIVTLMTLLVACRVVEVHASTRAYTYTPSSSELSNPERGFYRFVELNDYASLGGIAEETSLIYTPVRLDDFRSEALSDTFLAELNTNLALLRPAGLKVILRFAYNYPNDFESCALTPPQDAPLDIVLLHIQQLKPTLESFSDVIATLQAGFVGAWGEWHCSANQLDQPAARNAILQALQEALPDSRMLQLRYPGDMLELHPDALTKAEAFTGSLIARTGHHNDCFLASSTDVGTYFPLENKETYQAYLERMTPWTVVGGETCTPVVNESRFDCALATAEMTRFHWDYLNTDWHPEAIKLWQEQGCYDEIAKHLGYRFRLLSATLPVTAKGEVSFELSVANDGYGKLYNPRQLQLVLTSNQEAYTVPLQVDSTSDARMFMPSGQQSTKLTLSGSIASVPVGDYEAHLHFPDASANLAGMTAFTLQFANEGVYDPTTGYHRLGHKLSVTR